MSVVMYCHRCSLTGTPRLEYRYHNTGKHLGAWCTACDSWIKWVPQEGGWIDLYNQQHTHPFGDAE